MCGIAGYFGQFPSSLLEQMNRVQAHRGPDDAGTYHAENQGIGIGLAHRRLSILDLSPAGHQPMWDRQSEIAIVYNGEIYNFPELRAELESAGTPLRSRTDTEIVLELYKRMGPDMLSRLNGIFAFAIWDSRDRSLFLARDPMGVKPLYWARCPAGFLFASEIKALLQWPGLDKTIDSEALQHYLTYLWCPAPLTPLVSVRKLEPGHAMKLRAGKIERHWGYFHLPYDQPIEAKPATEARIEVRQTLAAAVRRQMLSDVPVGAFLSGGLDSSAVVAFAREAAPQPLPCFTIAVDPERQREEGQPDDLPFAKAMAQHLGVALHTVGVGHDAVRLLDTMVYHLDEPQGDPAPLNVLLISQRARERGIPVLLSGAGGDDIFSGYRRHVALAYDRVWNFLPRPLRAGIQSAASFMSARKPLARRLQKLFGAAALEENERIARYFCWMAPQTAARLAGRDDRRDADPLLKALAELPPGTPPLNRMLALETRFFLADHNLNYMDKMGMAAGVEIRVPFLDPALVSLAARLPVTFKQRGSTGKWILREAMRGILPDRLIDRPKTGFGAPLRHWLRHELRGVLDDIARPGSRLESHLDLRLLRELIAEDRLGRLDAAYPLFAALAIESWVRQFASAKPP